MYIRVPVYTQDNSVVDWQKANVTLSYLAFLEGMNSDISLAEKNRILNQLSVLEQKLI